jgi:cytosine deaminase
MDKFMEAATEEARRGLTGGGIPIGSVLVLDGEIIGRGHNRRVQKGSVVLHAEMDCLENAGRIKANDYKRSVLYSTLLPAICAAEQSCSMVSRGWSSARTRHLKGRSII